MTAKLGPPLMIKHLDLLPCFSSHDVFTWGAGIFAVLKSSRGCETESASWGGNGTARATRRSLYIGVSQCLRVSGSSLTARKLKHHLGANDLEAAQQNHTDCSKVSAAAMQYVDTELNTKKARHYGSVPLGSETQYRSSLPDPNTLQSLTATVVSLRRGAFGRMIGSGVTQGKSDDIV